MNKRVHRQSGMTENSSGAMNLLKKKSFPQPLKRVQNTWVTRETRVIVTSITLQEVADESLLSQGQNPSPRKFILQYVLNICVCVHNSVVRSSSVTGSLKGPSRQNGPLEKKTLKMPQGLSLPKKNINIYLKHHGTQLEVEMFHRVAIPQQANALHVEPVF